MLRSRLLLLNCDELPRSPLSLFCLLESNLLTDTLSDFLNPTLLLLLMPKRLFKLLAKFVLRSNFPTDWLRFIVHVVLVWLLVLLNIDTLFDIKFLLAILTPDGLGATVGLVRAVLLIIDAIFLTEFVAGLNIAFDC
ncbi:hypothetical protein MOUSESFB_0976 [Candidatus Arthromitus sp. SFB-mouse-Yit]|nr:hypothetical protein MOUSESFB_0976 [Candidatus Arthromitus sp. SFB-mouse-Yit]